MSGYIYIYYLDELQKTVELYRFRFYNNSVLEDMDLGVDLGSLDLYVKISELVENEKIKCEAGGLILEDKLKELDSVLSDMNPEIRYSCVVEMKETETGTSCPYKGKS